MPVIARFYGILIKMYFSQSEHGVPHFHAIYGEYNAVFDIQTMGCAFRRRRSASARATAGARMGHALPAGAAADVAEQRAQSTAWIGVGACMRQESKRFYLWRSGACG